jgi:hypothetical protein
VNEITMKKNLPLMKEVPSPVVAPFAPWPKDLLCVLCEPLAFSRLSYRKARKELPPRTQSQTTHQVKLNLCSQALKLRWLTLRRRPEPSRRPESRPVAYSTD